MRLRVQPLARSQLSSRPQSNGPGKFAPYYDHPVGFAKDVLGVDLWPGQQEILRAAHTSNRFAVRSGNKTGKSTSLVCVALWFACTRPRARVIMSAPTHRQIRAILWKELKRVYHDALEDLGGQLHEMPENGLQWGDGREIVGFFTTEPEKMAGISGPAVLFLVDEASGYPQEIFDSIEGNRAGGAKLGIASNPTMLSGYFHEAFTSKRHLWKLLHLSSEEAARQGIPGLATREWIDEKFDEWGEDSPLYSVRVLGEFPTLQENTIISMADIEGAIQRFDGDTPDAPLQIGVDVARFGDDWTVMCPRRGMRAFSLTRFRGDGMQVAGKVMEMVRFRRYSAYERVRVKVDVIGVGASVVDALQPFHETREIELVEVNVSETAFGERAQKEYANLRTQLWFDLAAWIRKGGCFPADGELEGELIAHRYKFQDRTGRREVLAKDKVKDILKRSPDKADALALAVFDGRSASFSAVGIPSRYSRVQ